VREIVSRKFSTDPVTDFGKVEKKFRGYGTSASVNSTPNVVVENDV
jgi:hypothetical protein